MVGKSSTHLERSSMSRSHEELGVAFEGLEGRREGSVGEGVVCVRIPFLGLVV